MKRETKAFEIEVKAGTDEDPPGTFEALVAVFGNVDRGGDRLMPGAFRKTLGRKGRGLPPILWSHDWNQPPIGVTHSAEETEAGLVVKGELFVETNALARDVHTAMLAKGGDGRAPLREFSFGYEAVRAKDVTEDGATVRQLLEVELYEVSPTLVGMNPATQLLGVKTDTIAEGSDTIVETEHEDSPPNVEQLSAEEAARIGRLLAERPATEVGPTY